MFVRKTLLLIGIVLLALNITGLFMSLRNQDIYIEFKNEVKLTYDQVLSAAVRLPQETNRDFLNRVNKAVYMGVAKTWDDNEIESNNLRVPIWENYLLYAASFVRPDIWKEYEFANPYKALERGVGLCSQHVIILTGILSDNGIEAQPIGLSGHVVMRVKVDENTWYVADPYYGVVIPGDIKEIEANAAILKNYYGDNKSVIEIFGKEGNVVYPKGVIGLFSYHPNVIKVYYIEIISYFAIWIIPVLMLLPYIVFLSKRNIV